MEEQIQELLNSIPQGVTYTSFPEELEPEDISQERIDGLKKLLTHEDVFIELCAAKLLCAWGIDEGFKALISYMKQENPKVILLVVCTVMKEPLNNCFGYYCVINLLKKRFQKKQVRKLNNKFALM